MLQKLPVNTFQWRNDGFNFYENFIHKYDEDSDKRYILGVYIKYSKELHGLHIDMPFLPDKMKINTC